MATSVKLDPDLKRRLDHLAEVKRRSAHWMMCEAIREYVAREEARESFADEARRSWQAYKETGRHLTVDETSKWLETWGTDDESEASDCHE